jgi:hypothetical protein
MTEHARPKSAMLAQLAANVAAAVNAIGASTGTAESLIKLPDIKIRFGCAKMGGSYWLAR